MLQYDWRMTFYFPLLQPIDFEYCFHMGIMEENYLGTSSTLKKVEDKKSW